jgi:hypothetical protein
MENTQAQLTEWAKVVSPSTTNTPVQRQIANAYGRARNYRTRTTPHDPFNEMVAAEKLNKICRTRGL